MDPASRISPNGKGNGGWLPVPGERRLWGGYLALYLPEHPFANSGWVPEHRAVFHATAGPGPFECYWCGRALRFIRALPSVPDVLLVDHVDGDKLNNNPSNLVAACRACNTTRHRYPQGVAAVRTARLIATSQLRNDGGGK